MSGVPGEVLRVEAHGVPRPQPRPRVLKSGKVVSTTGPAVAWKRLVLAAAREAVEGAEWGAIVDAPVDLVLVFRFGTTKRERWHRPRALNGRGDFDNMAKLVADVLTKRGVWSDDGLVAHVEQWHVWVPPEHAGVTVEVRRLSDAVLPWAREAWGNGDSGAVSGGRSAGRDARRARVAETETPPVGGAVGALSAPGWLDD